MLILLEPFVGTGDLLRRTPLEMLLALETFAVVVDDGGVVIGMGALKSYGSALAEVQTLAVREGSQGQGVGRRIVQHLIERARQDGVREVFALTRRPAFFQRLGFEPSSVEHFPAKIWRDCERCPRQDACDESAVRLLLDSLS